MDIKKMLWEKCAEFHGHECGGLTIGYKAALYVVELMNLQLDENGCIVTAPELKGEKPVYDENDFEEIDGYNIYLGGPLGLVTVENPKGTTGKELIIFRDSFASALAPLLMEGYDKITLIDLRYLASINVGRFVEFTDQDVLFLYSTNLVNNGKQVK